MTPPSERMVQMKYINLLVNLSPIPIWAIRHFVTVYGPSFGVTLFVTLFALLCLPVIVIIYNGCVCKNIREYVLYCLTFAIVQPLSTAVCGYVYYKTVSPDGETEAITRIFASFSVIYIVVLSCVAFLIQRKSLNSEKEK